MPESRIQNTFHFEIKDGQTESNTLDIRGGAFGTFIVPSGSDAIGKTMQIVAVPPKRQTPEHPETDLLSTAKTLAAGANSLIDDEISEAGAAGRVKLKLGTAVSGDVSIWLLWKA